MSTKQSTGTVDSSRTTELKYLRNADLREEICDIIGYKPDGQFFNESVANSRRFTNEERIAIIEYYLADYQFGPRIIADFTEQAVSKTLEHSTGGELNRLIGKLAQIELRRTSINRSGAAARLNREELKALYRSLEKLHQLRS